MQVTYTLALITNYSVQPDTETYGLMTKEQALDMAQAYQESGTNLVAYNLNTLVE